MYRLRSTQMAEGTQDARDCQKAQWLIATVVCVELWIPHLQRVSSVYIPACFGRASPPNLCDIRDALRDLAMNRTDRGGHSEHPNTLRPGALANAEGNQWT